MRLSVRQPTVGKSPAGWRFRLVENPAENLISPFGLVRISTTSEVVSYTAVDSPLVTGDILIPNSTRVNPSPRDLSRRLVCRGGSFAKAGGVR